METEVDSASDFASLRGDDLLEDASTPPTAAAAAAAAPVEDKVFVAVGKDLKAGKSTLLWALQHAGAKKLVIIFVHQPAQTVSILGGKFPISQLGEKEMKAHRESERQQVSRILAEYSRMCSKAGVQAEKEYIEMASIERGIVELVSKFRIGRLVMGAAADNKYSRKMLEPKSKKAIYVRQHAASSCHIWFVCKGRLIYTREGKVRCGISEEGETEQRVSSSSACDSSGMCTPWSKSAAGDSYDDLDQSSTMSIALSAARGSGFLSMSTREREHGLPRSPFAPTNDIVLRPSVSDSPANSMDERLYEQLELAMAEAETSKLRAFEESMKRRKAEKDIVDALRKVRLAEDLYFDEVKQRKEAEMELAKCRDELEKAKREREAMLEELRVAVDQKGSLERRLVRSDATVKEMEEKIALVMGLFENYNKQ